MNDNKASGKEEMLTSEDRELADAIVRATSPLIFALNDAMNRLTHDEWDLADDHYDEARLADGANEAHVPVKELRDAITD